MLQNGIVTVEASLVMTEDMLVVVVQVTMEGFTLPFNDKVTVGGTCVTVLLLVTVTVEAFCVIVKGIKPPLPVMVTVEVAVLPLPDIVAIEAFSTTVEVAKMLGGIGEVSAAPLSVMVLPLTVTVIVEGS